MQAPSRVHWSLPLRPPSGRTHAPTSPGGTFPSHHSRCWGNPLHPQVEVDGRVGLPVHREAAAPAPEDRAPPQVSVDPPASGARVHGHQDYRSIELVFRGNRHLAIAAGTALSTVPHKFTGRRDGPARFHGVPIRFEEWQELLSPLMFGRIALQRDSQPPYTSYGFSSLLYYNHVKTYLLRNCFKRPRR